MKRRILVFLCAVAFMAVGAAPALGNAAPGPNFPEPPGNTFPEQPGWTLESSSCEAIIGSPGAGPGGVFDDHAADIADDDITSPLLADACFGR